MTNNPLTASLREATPVVLAGLAVGTKSFRGIGSILIVDDDLHILEVLRDRQTQKPCGILT